MATKTNQTAYRGDNQTLTFAYMGTAPTEVRFYVRTKIDGDLLLGLKYTEKPTQFTINDTAKTIAVALLPADTSPIEHGDWYYDIDITQGTAITTLFYGLFQLQGDIATVVATDTPPALEYHTPVDLSKSEVLIQWTEGHNYEMTARTYNAIYPTVLASATVKWPDGCAGALTITSTNTTWLEEDAYTITHVDGATTLTVTQAAVTRNANGMITVKPALTVA